MPAITKAITKANAVVLREAPSERMRHSPHVVRRFWGIMIILFLGAVTTFVFRSEHEKTKLMTALAEHAKPPANAVLKTAGTPNASLPQIDPELEIALRKAPIKAIIAGDASRVLIGTKIIEIGQNITDGLVLVKIENKTLFARDEAGAIYTRSY